MRYEFLLTLDKGRDFKNDINKKHILKKLSLNGE